MFAKVPEQVFPVQLSCCFQYLSTIGMVNSYALTRSDSASYLCFYRCHVRLFMAVPSWDVFGRCSVREDKRTRMITMHQLRSHKWRTKSWDLTSALCISYAFPIHIPSIDIPPCLRLGNKASDDKKDFKLRPKGLNHPLQWHRWHWHLERVTAAILSTRSRPTLPLSTRGVSGPWVLESRWNGCKCSFLNDTRRAGPSSAS